MSLTMGWLLRQERSFGSAARRGWERVSIGFEKEEAYLSLVLKNTVIGDPETGRRTSNSIIVYGPPGAGKTTVVESVLAKLDNDEDEEFKQGRLIVRLDGLLCPDFKSSVDEICWHLRCGEPFEEEEEGSLNMIEDDKVFSEMEKARNFDDRLDQVMQFLRTSMETLNKAIVFVLDKLDMFAEHPNQHLLYNLFDLVANSKTTIPICVIGITDRVDVLEMFEKRVKSRFSHRNINICPTDDFNKYMKIVGRLLKFPEEGVMDEMLEEMSPKKRRKVERKKQAWNTRVEELLKTNEIQRILRCVFDMDSTILRLTSFLFSIVLPVQDELTLAHFKQGYADCIVKNEVIRMALDLPVSDLIALLAIYKQLQNNRHLAWQPTNLYRVVDKILMSQGLGKEDFMKSIRKLETMQFIIPIRPSQRNFGGNAAELFYKSEITVSELKEIWNKYPQLPSSFEELL